MHGQADAYLDEAGQAGETLLFARNVNGLAFENNDISNYGSGLGLLKITDAVISGNDFSSLQKDGIQGAEWRDLEISGNYFHDFFGSANSLNHDDMIQMWGRNADTLSENVRISGNILNSNGNVSQGIFIRNEDFGKDSEAGGYFRNLEITDNVVFTGAPHAITAADVNGLKMNSNTVIWNHDEEDPRSSSMPWIMAKNSESVSVQNNISGKYRIIDNKGTVDVSDNVKLDYKNSDSPYYAHEHFANITSEIESPSDFFLQPGSLLAGMGSRIDLASFLSGESVDVPEDTSEPAPEKPQMEEPDEQESDVKGDSGEAGEVDEPESEAEPDLEPAPEPDGEPAVIGSLAEKLALQGSTLLDLDFASGLRDVSDDQSNLELRGAEAETAFGVRDGEEVFHLSDDAKINIGKGSDKFSNLTDFAIGLDMAKDAADGSGGLLSLHTVFELDVLADGSLSFWLKTDEGRFGIRTDKNILSDTKRHDLDVVYSDQKDMLTLYLDGKNVGQTDASGQTGSVPWWPLTLGESWGDTVDSTVYDLSVVSQMGDLQVA